MRLAIDLGYDSGQMRAAHSRRYLLRVTQLWALARNRGVDLVIVIAAVGTALGVALRHDASHASRTSLWLTVPVVAVLVLVLLGRRRWPFVAAGSVWLIGAAISLVDGRLIPSSAGATAAGLVASFLLGQVADERRARIGLAIVLGGVVLIVYNDPNHSTTDLISMPVPFAIAWVAGVAVRQRGVRADIAEQLARRAESEREATARVAVAEERARIARELHDIVAHAMSVIVLQVGAVRHNLPDSLAADKDALRAVERTGRTALTEMRRLLGAMRSEGADLELTPQPGLGNLDPLFDEVRRAGLPVHLRVEGQHIDLPHALDLSAYRIVQEGLTNALKHAQATRVDVLVRYRADQLRIDVTDNGRALAQGDGLGHGLIGIRERVNVYGGEMTARSDADGGFVLSTRFPLDGGRG
jgi:signal transduction histidine kinase